MLDRPREILTKAIAAELFRLYCDIGPLRTIARAVEDFLYFNKDAGSQYPQEVWLEATRNRAKRDKWEKKAIQLDTSDDEGVIRARRRRVWQRFNDLQYETGRQAMGLSMERIEQFMESSRAGGAGLTSQATVQLFTAAAQIMRIAQDSAYEDSKERISRQAAKNNNVVQIVVATDTSEGKTVRVSQPENTERVKVIDSGPTTFIEDDEE